jgi:hypothetical protein
LNALISPGRSAEDSAAVIYDGTLPTQETLVGEARRDEQRGRPLERSAARRFWSSAVLVALREHLR